MSSEKPVSGTEQLHPKAAGLDKMPDKDILSIMLDSHISAGQTLSTALRSIASASELMADSIRENGRLIYAAAGASGMMALADAIEMNTTFGLPRESVVLLLAGGLPQLSDFTNVAEDDEQAAIDAMDQLKIKPQDCVIGVAASGTTPYTVAALQHAQRCNCRSIGISCNPDTALLAAAKLPVLIATDPEAIAGSTRLGAATAQKIALNMMSTLMAVKLGHIYDGQMVNMIADSAKLRERAARIVAGIAGCNASDAAASLMQAQGSIKLAVLLACGCENLASAKTALAAADGNIRTALDSSAESQ